MMPRKSKWADLERHRTLFFMLGLALSMFAVLMIFNIRTYDKTDDRIVEPPVKVISDEEIPITYRPEPAGAPPPPVIEQINVIENFEEVDTELDMMATETDENEAVYAPVDPGAPVGEEGIKYIAYEEEEPEEVLNFEVVESVPVFPGCESAKGNEERKQCFQQQILAFVQKEFQYPRRALEMGLQGKVFVEFIIEKDGSISNITVIRGADPMLDREAVRVITNLPHIAPATQRGKPVRMRFIMPITARFQER